MIKKLCVLLPAYNEECVIAATLPSIKEAGLPVGLETADIFVINDCSKDKTAEIASNFGAIVLTNQINMGKTRGIEKAIRDLRLEEKYEYVSILDADTLLDPNYFVKSLERFERDQRISAVCGQPKSLPYNWLTAYRALEYAWVHRVFKQGQSVMGTITISAGCASIYKTSVIAQIEWHPDRIIIEDADITPQIHRKQLGTIIYEKNAVVFTQDPHTLKSYIGQLRRWYKGIWQAAVVYKIPFGWQKVDLEYALMTGETLIFSVAVALLPLWLVLFPTQTLYVLAVDQIFWLIVSWFCSVWTGRFDIIKYAPTFFVPRFLSAIIFLESFWCAVIMQHNTEPWFRPHRYELTHILKKQEGQ